MVENLEANAETLQKMIRLHWCLDVAFSEYASRKCTGHEAQNFAILYKIALNLLENDQSVKFGVKSKRLKAAWSNK